jgi:hypothetical protein
MNCWDVEEISASFPSVPTAMMAEFEIVSLAPENSTVVSRWRAVLGTSCAALDVVPPTTVRFTSTESTPVLGTSAWPRIWNGYQVLAVTGPVIPPRPDLVSTARPCAGTNTPACTEGVDCAGTTAGTAPGTAGPDSAGGATDAGAADAGTANP